MERTRNQPPLSRSTTVTISLSHDSASVHRDYNGTR